MDLKAFAQADFITALKDFFTQLNIPMNHVADEPIAATEILENSYKNTEAFELINDVYFVGMVDDKAFAGENSPAPKDITADYDGILVFGVTLKNRTNNQLPTRTQLAEITRAFNKEYDYTPVMVVFKYNNHLAFANTERLKYIQQWREGEKAGKVTMLKDVDIHNTHAAHIKIIFGDNNHNGLKIDARNINTFSKLYKYWQSVFSLQSLNDQFYADLQKWFYFASQNIVLPYKQEYINEKENIKNFLVRLLARTLFCWFVKEKGLIKAELLELYNWENQPYSLTYDLSQEDFLQNNSYYRGILQNIFFNALNSKEKKSEIDFNWRKYIHPDFDYDAFIRIPYLNGGIF